MSKRLSKKQYYRRKRIQRIVRMSFVWAIAICILCIGILKVGPHIFYRFHNPMNHYKEEAFVLDGVKLYNGKKVKADLLTPNPYSRPETKIKRINGIVIHYVGNPGTTAQNNRDYFDHLSETKDRYASSHFVVGLDGEIIQCIPLNEMSYASNKRNVDTISIEVCHPDMTGKFNKNTYDSVVSLTAHLCKMFDLNSEDVIRHYDVTGKLCPLYYVQHKKAWKQLKKDIAKEMKKEK